MKIRILSNIPGMSKGKIIDIPTNFSDEFKFFKAYGHIYDPNELIRRGWAEYIKDEIDIEAIRRKYNHNIRNSVDWALDFTSEDVLFINSYRIVKAVIDQLNSDWKHENGNPVVEIFYNPVNKKFFSKCYFVIFTSQLPPMMDTTIAQKVIELCEPELKVLFGIE